MDGDARTGATEAQAHGHCDVERRLIEILFVSEDDDALDMLLIHDISHAVASLGHGKTWHPLLALAAATARKLGRVRLAELLDTEIDNYQNRGEGLPEIYAEVRMPCSTTRTSRSRRSSMVGAGVWPACRRGQQGVPWPADGVRAGPEGRIGVSPGPRRGKEGMGEAMTDDVDDFFTEDLLTEKKKSKKRKADGKRKGTAELELVKVFNKRFGGGFSRSVGSGNRWGQVTHLPKHAQEVFSGDLIVPQGFKWASESKGAIGDRHELGVRRRQQRTGRVSRTGDEGRHAAGGSRCCAGSGTGSRGWRSCRQRNWRGIPSSTGFSTRNGRRWRWRSC